MTLKPTHSVADELAERLTSLKQLQDDMNAAIAAADQRSHPEQVTRETTEPTETVSPLDSPLKSDTYEPT